MAKIGKSVKLNITIKEDLLSRADSYADENGMTRSGLLSLALTQYLNSVEAMPSVNKLMASMAALVDGTFNGALDPAEAEKRMESIQAAYKLLVDKK